MGSNKVSVDNHLKVSATPSLATIIFTESARAGKSGETRTRSWFKSKWLKTVETTVLAGVILFVCGLFTIPTILYVIPPLSQVLKLIVWYSESLANTVLLNQLL